MLFAEFLNQDRIIFLKSLTKEDAFSELAELLYTQDTSLDTEKVLQEIWKRENLVTTKIAPGIAIPHAKVDYLMSPIIVVGVSSTGVIYDTNDSDKVHLMIMILSDSERYLPILSGIAAQLNDKDIFKQIITAKSVYEIYTILTSPFIPETMHGGDMDLVLSVFKHACQIYKESNAAALVVYGDAIDDIQPILKEISFGELIIITHMKDKYGFLENKKNISIIQVPFGKLNRTGQIDLSHLFIASKGLVKKNDRIVSVYGKKNSGMFDTVMISTIDKEYTEYFQNEPEILPPDLNEEVFARSVQLLGDLAAEGREGKAVGTIFVLADHEQVMPYCQQMVVNPFRGIDEAERNIVDPGLEETIKEFSKMDGAFIIRGDGVVIASGTYLSTHMPDAEFLRGLGARHAAAASITSASNALAMVLSESTRKISFFRSGRRFLVF